MDERSSEAGQHYFNPHTTQGTFGNNATETLRNKETYRETLPLIQAAKLEAQIDQPSPRRGMSPKESKKQFKIPSISLPNSKKLILKNEL